MRSRSTTASAAASHGTGQRRPAVRADRSPSRSSGRRTSPFLYDLQRRRSQDGGKTVDAVTSYFGMRKISSATDEKGVTRIVAERQTVFLVGPLDQGFWPDGLYTAPTDEALQVRHRDHQKARLQHDAQARQGRAGPLVLLVRQARPAGLAGHAGRRPQHRRRASPTSSARRSRRSSTSGS